MYANDFLRLTLAGTISSTEIFSISLSLDAPLTDNVLDIGDNEMDAITTACTEYWARATTRVSSLARLKRVKCARIDETGHYASGPVERAVDIPGASLYTDAGVQTVWQVAHKVTLRTDGDLGRVKGGFYLPCPDMRGLDVTTNQFSVSRAEEVRNSTETFLEALNNAPWFDSANELRVVVASQGRRNRDGSVRAPSANHVVNGVHVGRRPDIIRRRANAVAEIPSPPNVVS